MPDFIAAVIDTSKYVEDGGRQKWLREGGAFLLKGNTEVTLSGANYTWGVCTGNPNGTGSSSGDFKIEKDALLKVNGLQGFVVGRGSEVTISGTFDVSGCEEDGVAANVLTLDAVKIDGTVKMARSAYMDIRSTDLTVQAKAGSTGSIFSSDLRSIWVLSDRRGFGYPWNIYCNERTENIKKLYVAEGAVFTIIPNGEIKEDNGDDIDQTLKFSLSSLSDLSGDGYVKIEDGGTVVLTLDGISAADVQALDMFCGRVTLNGTETEFHAGGTATCQEKAKCAVCDTEYGEKAAHSLGALIEECPATRSDAGMKAHYVCGVCGSYFDENQNPAEESDLTIPKLSGGGKSSSSSGNGQNYVIDAPKNIKNGSVTMNPEKASKGSNVTVSVKPDSGYELKRLAVKDSDNNELKLTDKGNGQYTFVMPGSNVKVEAEFGKPQEKAFFKDVAEKDYYYDAVKWAVEQGITNGVRDDLFGSDQLCTRSQIITFLWRAAGSPEPKEMRLPTDCCTGCVLREGGCLGAGAGDRSGDRRRPIQSECGLHPGTERNLPFPHPWYSAEERKGDIPRCTGKQLLRGCGCVGCGKRYHKRHRERFVRTEQELHPQRDRDLPVSRVFGTEVSK